jgi:hypothetical protein
MALDPISKITKVKRAGSMAQVVEYLHSKYKVLSSTPSTTKNLEIKSGYYNRYH